MTEIDSTEKTDGIRHDQGVRKERQKTGAVNTCHVRSIRYFPGVKPNQTLKEH